MRCKRLSAPHGTRQVPQSRVSRAIALSSPASQVSRCSTPACPNASSQRSNTVIATDDVSARRLHPASTAIAARAESDALLESRSNSGSSESAPITYLSNAARCQASHVKRGVSPRILRDARPRRLSPSCTMYLGNLEESGLPLLVSRNGVVLQFCIHPVAGLRSWGSWSIV